MKSFISNLPIRLKLTSAIVVASFLVLILLCSIFMIAEVYSFRSVMVSNIMVVADLLNTNSESALMSRNKSLGEKALASLQAQPQIRTAYLFDLSGKPLGQYLDRSDMKLINRAIKNDFSELNTDMWRTSKRVVIHFDWSHLSLFSPVHYQGEKVGTLYLLSDNKDLYGRIYVMLFGFLLALGLMIPFSLLMARYLTNPIAEPLLSLVDKMLKVSRNSDFSVRAEKSSRDEVGDLVDGFNDMLTQIEIRDAKLSDHQKYLEEMVVHRTMELQKSVSELETATQVAVEANQAKSEFLANMTHELRTPLIGVLGMNELLTRTQLSGQQQSLVSTVQRSGEDLLSMINDILDFSKIEAGHMRLENVEVDIFKIVEDTTWLLSEKAMEKGLGISCQVMPDAMWKVQSDPVRIRQILLNLIGNAVKFTSTGEIAVRLDMTMPGQGLGCFVLEVKDTGAGMCEEEQARVFSAFVQADSSTTRQHGGTGLGLTIVQQLVSLLDGKLSVESRKGEGSLFRAEMTLPLVSKQLPVLPESLHGGRVLLYDDRSADQEIIHSMLVGLGLQVVMTSSVEDAWYQLLSESRQRFPFDFAIVSTEAKLADGALLYEKVMKENLLSSLRTIGICPRKSLLENILSDDMPVLNKPVLWSTLVKCLVRCWNKIEIVPPPVDVKPSRKTPQTVQPNRPPDSSIPRILLADDNAVTRELICLSLVKYSCQIDQVVNGLEALSAIDSGTYDLILMDCNMPELDGIEATRRLRLQGCHVPVIALTAHADQRVFDSCKNTGMNDLLRKPFRQKELHGIVEKWLAPDLNECSRNDSVAGGDS